MRKYNVTAAGGVRALAVVIGLAAHGRSAFGDMIPTFLEQVSVSASAGGVGTDDSQRFDQQSNAPFVLSAVAQSSGGDDQGGFDNGPYSWSTSAVGSGGVNGAGLYGLASASAALGNIDGIGADGYVSVNVTRTVIVHLANPSQPVSLSCLSTVNGSILHAGALNYDISVSDDNDNFSANVTDGDFAVDGSTAQVKSTGMFNNVTDGTVLTISQGLSLDAHIPGSESDSDDDDFSDTFWLQLLPTTPGVTLETSDGTDFTQAYVPEPGSISIGAMAAGLLLLRRKNNGKF